MSLKQVNTTLDLELVTTKPEYESLIPPLTKEEYQKLKDSIKENGLWEPIIVNQHNIVLDGHNRLKICKQLYIIPRFSVREFKDPLDEKLYVIDSNLIRRQLPILSAAKVGIKREEIEAERAKQRHEAQRGEDGQYSPLAPNETRGKAMDQAAKAVGLSPTTYHRAKTVLERGTPELIEQVDNGETSVSKAYELITKPHVANATGENEWYTPEPYIEAAKTTMGNIDIDPASTEIANQIVKASKFYTAKEDGRLQNWYGTVWMNPPYSQPLITEFCDLLVEKYKDGEVEQACVLVNNATETKFYQNMLKTCKAVCFIEGRVKFIDKNGNPSGAPLQGQTILYFGDNITQFAENFKKFGVILYDR